MPHATELLVGLWLRGLKQPKCEKTITEWRHALAGSPGSANDNSPRDVAEAKARAIALLDATCATCAKVCPRRGFTSPAPPTLASLPM
jgi:hypothetical protein